LREVLSSCGCDIADLLKDIKFKSVTPRKAVIPSRENLQKIVDAIKAQPRCNPESPEIVQLIAQTGMRCKEVRLSRVEHVDWKTNRLLILGAKGKGGEPKLRYLPIHTALSETLCRIIGTRKDGPLFKTLDVHKSLGTACETIGIPHISPHDLRDVFTTTCIESSVDFHTLAGWLGHSDGGALLMRTYAHLRDEHSQLMAQRVKF
jgi:integrase